MSRNKHLGSSFDALMYEQGLLEEVDSAAIKRVLAWQLQEEMKKQGISKLEMARRMQTSRSQLDRFLDPQNDKVLLRTVQRAALAVGKRISLQLAEPEVSPKASRTKTAVGKAPLQRPAAKRHKRQLQV
jgi:antitoxin HicB